MFELSLQCPQDQVETVADALEALGAQSVGVEDADALTAAEQALFGEPGLVPEKIGWKHSHIRALFPSHAQAHEALQILSAQDFFAECHQAGVTGVPEQDWVRLTQTQFAPVSITPEFWIVPTWHEPPSQARRVIRLDPGLAFGTGTHPTTWLCLRWIAQTSAHSALGRVLDYGCGSGILAIAAALHGSNEVDAVDIDSTAVEAARLNALANRVTIHSGTPELASERYDTVLANILATPLRVLAPLLCARIAPGGRLVLAGILERQADELVQAYAPYVRLKVTASLDGWILMTTDA